MKYEPTAAIPIGNKPPTNLDVPSTPWAILAALVVISGLGYFDWYAATIGTVIPFSVHIYYDFFLMMCIIIHIGVGFKFMFMRRKISQKPTNIFIFLLISILIVVLILLNFIL